ncbi:MAG: uncharacterized protein QOJ68_3533 [Blastococcus sp.]|nr:uncharacterized protein [Blastococcus sp.]
MRRDSTTAPVVPAGGRLSPLGIDEVRITGGFWAERQRVNGAASIRHAQEWMERLGWIGNFDAAREGRPHRTGREFADSDVYKLLEAMAWEIGRTEDADLEARFTGIVARIAPAQESDGYLNTRFGRPGQAARYSDLEWGHELYCAGHLLQAAVARGRTGGDDLLVRIARRVADHVCAEFGDDADPRVDGHPEIEVALAEFARYTGEERYLQQARRFVERRGRGALQDIELGRAYFQDDEPVRQATVLRGHAVRALYLAAGALDVAADTGDPELLQSVEGQYARTLARRTYLTGGMGSRHEGEAFGADYELPPDRAYAETCAGVGSVMVAHRLLLATGDLRYGDQVERTLFNVVAASPAEDGRSFFYANPLHQREPGAVPDPDAVSPRASSSSRAPWFEVSCCPPNVARTLASLGAYLATKDRAGVQVHQFADADIDTSLADGMPVRIAMRTEYPATGLLRLAVETDSAAPWTLSVRIPAWATGARATLNGEPVAVGPAAVQVTRAWRSGDELLLELPLVSRWTAPDPRIDAVRGCLAVERGPLVLCLESVDVPDGVPLADLQLVADRPPVDEDGATRVLLRRLPPGPADGWPYGDAERPPADQDEPHEVALLPYHRWANRGPSTMRVWLPVA